MKFANQSSAVNNSVPAIHMIAQSLTGSHHAVRAQENEDSIACFEDERIFAVAVSDGCSSSTAAKAASQASCQAALEFAKSKEVWNKDSDVKSAFLDAVDNSYMDTKLPYELLKATLLVLVISKISGDYVGISIGDCASLVIDQALNQPEVLLNPYNVLLQKTRTIFANGRDAESAMLIVRGKIQDKAGFVLFTDGAKPLLTETYEENVKKIVGLTAINATELAQSELDAVANTFQQEGTDDVSILAIGFENDTTTRIASTLYQPKEAPDNGEPGVEPEPDTPPQNEPDTSEPDTPEQAASEPSLSQEFTAETLLKSRIVKSPSEFFLYVSPFLKNGLMFYDAASGAFRFCDLSKHS